ncbi:MAG: tetratricopeptide repeat protein, partial [Cyanobacteria bacterium CAN_BIN43]|nr:tetratricopeptide repeat protein [Cyanobacteria bacterium CAN_BIN43]
LYRYEEALPCFDKSTALNPTYYRGWFSRAVALASLQRYEKALESLDQAVKAKPSCYYAWNYRGVVLTKLNRHGEAIASFDTALQHKTDNPNAWYGKACSYALQQNGEMAVKNIHRAIVLSPHLCRVMAHTDASFDGIRDSQAFRALLG